MRVCVYVMIMTALVSCGGASHSSAPAVVDVRPSGGRRIVVPSDDPGVCTFWSDAWHGMLGRLENPEEDIAYPAGVPARFTLRNERSARADVEIRMHGWHVWGSVTRQPFLATRETIEWNRFVRAVPGTMVHAQVVDENVSVRIDLPGVTTEEPLGRNLPCESLMPPDGRAPEIEGTGWIQPRIPFELFLEPAGALLATIDGRDGVEVRELHRRNQWTEVEMAIGSAIVHGWVRVPIDHEPRGGIVGGFEEWDQSTSTYVCPFDLPLRYGESVFGLIEAGTTFRTRARSRDLVSPEGLNIQYAEIGDADLEHCHIGE